MTRAYDLAPVPFAPGFENVLSTAGMSTLGRIAMDEATMRNQLGLSALKELGATERIEMQLDAAARDNELARRDARRGNILRMAGSLLMSPSTGGFAVAGNASAPDPLALVEQIRRFNESTRGELATRMRGSNTAAAEILKGLS